MLSVKRGLIYPTPLWQYLYDFEEVVVYGLFLNNYTFSIDNTRKKTYNELVVVLYIMIKMKKYIQGRLERWL